MDMGVKIQRFCITDLPDDYLYLIFEKLNESLDRKSFGLTCHRFLDIQNSSRKRLDLRAFNRSDGLKCTVIIDSSKLDSLLKRFRELEFLSLSGCIYVSDSGLTQLQICGSKFHSLYLDGLFDVTIEGFSYIASGCPLLSVISLFHCKITARGLKRLTESCKHLKKVDIARCDKITDSGIRSLIQNCPQLRTLNISWCCKITGIGFQGCSPTLACVKADNCVLSSTGIAQMLSGGGLEYLSLAFIKCIEGNGLAAIGLGLAPNLKALDFYKCDFVTDDVILSISQGCPLLQEWDLSYCDHIRTSGYGPIGLHCQNLEIIHLNGCFNFRREAFLALVNGCKRLSEIHMKNCPLVFLPDLLGTLRDDLKIIERETRRTVPSWVFTR